jgi:hypothetical protein
MVQDPYIFQGVLFPNIYVVYNIFVIGIDYCEDKNYAGLEVTVVGMINILCTLHLAPSQE